MALFVDAKSPSLTQCSARSSDTFALVKAEETSISLQGSFVCVMLAPQQVLRTRGSLSNMESDTEGDGLKLGHNMPRDIKMLFGSF